MVFKIEQLRWLGQQQIQSCTIAKGERLCIRGASGSGKTTFLKFFNLFAQPDEGVIYYQQQALTKYT
ncbi:MAG: ATP-binding cassette domain-containing protein, partial [Culicoidibacterales bacterium]